jgi:hypothetical protein
MSYVVLSTRRGSPVRPPGGARPVVGGRASRGWSSRRAVPEIGRATARPGGSAPCAYRDLGVWLARAIGPARALRGVENTGRQIGRELAPKPTDPPAAALQSSLSALGFQPTLDVRPPGRATFRLGNCPYRDAVHENQPAICALHKGITRGLLDVLAPGVRLTGFVPHDPDSAGCVIELNAVGDRAV